MAIDKVVCCSNNHRFRLGSTGDGYRDCPECNQLLKEVPADVTKGEPFTLRYVYQAFIKKKEHKSSARNLSIDVAINTDNLQLKLRAIAKHTEALADELDNIDNDITCPDCGGYEIDKVKTYDNEDFFSCNGCECSFDQKDLPTRLEGSD